mmetsp:Transcript_37033/g.118731  ORF Transcript_37033/g.118731 Transcript_37033/m.118731 type:complete len:299 (-) Transcript_37033:1131-2027(-)
MLPVEGLLAVEHGLGRHDEGVEVVGARRRFGEAVLLEDRDALRRVVLLVLFFSSPFWRPFLGCVVFFLLLPFPWKGAAVDGDVELLTGLDATRDDGVAELAPDGEAQGVAGPRPGRDDERPGRPGSFFFFPLFEAKDLVVFLVVKRDPGVDAAEVAGLEVVEWSLFVDVGLAVLPEDDVGIRGVVVDLFDADPREEVDLEIVRREEGVAVEELEVRRELVGEGLAFRVVVLDVLENGLPLREATIVLGKRQVPVVEVVEALIVGLPVVLRVRKDEDVADGGRSSSAAGLGPVKKRLDD